MIQALRLNGAPVTAPVINTFVKGMVMAIDRTILVEHGMSLSYDELETSFTAWREKGRK